MLEMGGDGLAARQTLTGGQAEKQQSLREFEDTLPVGIPIISLYPHYLLLFLFCTDFPTSPRFGKLCRSGKPFLLHRRCRR